MLEDDRAAAGTGRPVARAAAATYGATVIVAILSLANVLVIAGTLGPVGRGDVVFLMTVAGLTGYVFSLSVQEANANFAGQEPQARPSLATNSVILAIVLGALGAAGVYGFGELVPAARGDVERDLVVLVLPAIPLIILQNYLMLLVRSDFAAGIANVALLIPAALNVAVNGGLALAGAISVTTAVVTWVVTQGLATATLVWYVMTRLAGFGAPDAPLSRRSLSFGLKSHGGGVMAAGNFRLDQWILGSLAGSRELGLYSVAVAFAEALFFLPQALVLVVRPNLVRATPEEARESALVVTRFAILATVPLAVGLALAAPILCVSLLGEEFTDSVTQLRLLLPGALGIVVLKILGNALVARGRPLLETAGIGSAFVVTIVLNALLIPPYGGTGAAIASSAAYGIAGVAIGVIFMRVFGGRMRELIPGRGDISETVRRVRALGRTGPRPVER